MTLSPARRGSTAALGGLLLALLLTIPAIAPLTYPGFFEAHSGFLPPFNASHPQAAPNWGRQPDLIRGEGALPYLLVRPIYALTGSGVAAVEWGYALAFLLGAAAVYAWTRRWFGMRGAVLSAAVYTYLPWHLATVYVRGAYAEAWLWAWCPLAVYALDRLGRGSVRAVAVAAAVGLPALAALFWTQPGLAGLFLLILLPYTMVTSLARRGLAIRLALALVFLTLLSWLLIRRAGPAPVAFADHYLYPFQLLSAQWGTGISVPGALDGLPFQLGLAAAGLFLVTLALWRPELARASSLEASAAPDQPGPPPPPVGSGPGSTGTAGQVDDTPPLRRALFSWWAILAIVVLLVLPLAAPLWRLTHLEALLTYPWQLLLFVGLPLAFLSGAVPRLDSRLATWPAWAGLVALVLLASYSYLAPEFTQAGTGRDLGPEPIAFFQPVEADAPQIALLDVDVEPPTALTLTLTLTLTWQAVAPVAGDYTVFVHALDGQEKVAQQDTRPCTAQCPTDTWQPGDIIVDRYQVALPAGAVGRLDRLALGLYLLDTGERATVYGQEDRTVYIDVP